MFRTGLFQLSSTFTKVLLTLLTGVSRGTGDEIPGWRDLDLAEVQQYILKEISKPPVFEDRRSQKCWPCFIGQLIFCASEDLAFKKDTQLQRKP